MHRIKFRSMAAAPVGMFFSASALNAETQTSNALALLRWHGFRVLRDASQNTVILWVLAGIAILCLFIWVAQRRRRRWF
jgi:hypothetical protein